MHRILYVLVGVSVAIDIALGAWASVGWKSFASFWFLEDGLDMSAGAQLLGLVLGIALLFFAALQVFALRQIRSDQGAGFPILMGFGGYLVVSAVVVFFVAQSVDVLRFGGLEFLLVDGLRGALLASVAALAMREPATVREIRLPSAEERARVRPPREREPERRRSGRRSGFDSPRGGERRRQSASRGSGDRGGRGGRRRRRPPGSRDGDRSGSSVPAA